MKAMSIIGMVLSCFLIFLSFRIMDINCYSEWGTEHRGLSPGLLTFVISCFFLALSIVGCVSAFRKKN